MQGNADNIIAWFRENRPDVHSELDFKDAYQLLVAVMLSAQCTDKRVNLTTPALFKAYPDVTALSKASEKDVLELIKSISYPNSKANHLVAAAKMIVNDFGSKIPDDIDELMKIPGVGRKTANVVASIIYDKPVIAVDTHVFRVSHRLGLSDGKTPDAVENDLERLIPEEFRAKAHHWLILHGRYVCTARNPKCRQFEVSRWCESFSVKK